MKHFIIAARIYFILVLVFILFNQGCGGEMGPPPLDDGAQEFTEETLEAASDEKEHAIKEPTKVELPKVQVIDINGVEEKGRRVRGHLSLGGYDIRDWIRVSGPHHFTKIYYRRGFKDKALEVARGLEGRQLVEEINWESPYDLVLFVGTRPEEYYLKGELGFETKEEKKEVKRKIKVNTIYYVTAKRYYHVYDVDVTKKGEVSVFLEKIVPMKGFYPKITIRAYDKDEKIMHTDSKRLKVFKGKDQGFKGDEILVYPQESEPSRLEVEVKVYDEVDSLVLN